MNNNNRNNYVAAVRGMSHDALLSELRRQIAAAKSSRCAHQQRQKEHWKDVTRTRRDRSQEISRDDAHIGEATYKINQVIAQIVKRCRGTEAARVAANYLDEEIERNRKIVASREKLRSDVAKGKSVYVSSTGKITHNHHVDDQYIAHKKEQLSRLIEWRRKLR